MMEAQVFLTGNLGQDARVTNFQNGNAVIEFSVASNSFYTDKSGETVQKTDWHDCKRYVKTVSPALVEKLIKGTTIVIAGTLRYDTYDKEVSKSRQVSMKKAWIDVRELTLA